jgi:cell filamentation protein
MSQAAGGNLYEYPNGVLRNRFGIMDAALLQEAETILVAVHQGELRLYPIAGNVDLDHLRAIQRALFQDVYEWVGELQLVDISKGNSLFARFNYIASSAAKIFTKLAQEHHLRGLPLDQFAQRAAYYLGEINALHAFREGNGRTQRIFFNELANQAGYQLEWDRVTQQQMIDASEQSLIRGNNSGLEQIFQAILVPIQP